MLSKDGRHPEQGLFGEELAGIWKSLTGNPLQCRGQVAHMGADWEAFSDLCGLRRWNHNAAPCPWCSTPLCDMHKYTKEYHCLTKDDWDAAKAATQVTVRLSPASAQAIRENRAPELRKVGSLGKALTCNVGSSLGENGLLNSISTQHLVFIHM